MVWLFSDPRFLDHDTGAHPESPARLEAIATMLAETGRGNRFQQGECRPASDEELLGVHTRKHLQRLNLIDQAGGGRIDADTVLGPRSLAVARLAAGSVCAAVEAVCRSEDPRAVVIARPPGHHAEPNQAMGFCLFNNVAIAAAYAREALKLERVLIVDWDVHHGNGTQEIFYSDSQVGYLSLHRAPFYPGTGAAEEIGAGPGRGTTWNRPLPAETNPRDYHRCFESALRSAAAWMKPELILVSAGFDAHADDPIGGLGLETDDFRQLTRNVLNVAQAHAQGRLVSILEGGYNPPVLADCVAAHLDILQEH